MIIRRLTLKYLRSTRHGNVWERSVSAPSILPAIRSNLQQRIPGAQTDDAFHTVIYFCFVPVLRDQINIEEKLSIREFIYAVGSNNQAPSLHILTNKRENLCIIL